MNTNAMETMLVLNIHTELEEELVDYLLALDCVAGFTSYHVHGHGRSEAMTVAEQVSGRRKRIQVEILLKEQDVARVLEGLAGEVGRDITFWRQPVAGFGRIE